jgi:hypothetical protein
MKRIVLAIALVVLFAVPAMAQNVDVTFNGEFWGVFASPSGESNSFETYSPFTAAGSWWGIHPTEYSFVNLNGKVGNNLGFTYTYDVTFQETDQVFGSFLPNAGAINEVRAGQFWLPIGLNEFFNTYGTGAAVLGKIGAFDYNLAYTSNNALSIDNSALSLKVNTNMRLARVGATAFHAADDIDIFGVDASTGIGPFGLKAEYLFANVYGDFKEKDFFLGGEYAYSDKTTFFINYYNADYAGNSYDGNKVGVSCKINDNADLRAMFVNGPILGTGFEAALKTTF